MKTRNDLASAIRQLATATIEAAGAIREFAQAIQGIRRLNLYHPSDTAEPPPGTWKDTDVAFARRALRPLSHFNPEEWTILERMRQRLRKTMPSPIPEE